MAASITYQHNTGTEGTPVWSAMAANTLVFSGAADDLAATIATDDCNDGTHCGADDPGADNCSAGPSNPVDHMPNAKYEDASNLFLNGTSKAINDANVPESLCTLRVHLNNDSTILTQNTYFFCFDGTTDTDEAVGIESYGFERGETNDSWYPINDDSGNIGGNNADERLDLAEEQTTPSQDHYWYIALTARGESAGPKTSFDYKTVTEIY